MQEIIRFFSRHPILGITWIGLLIAILFIIFKDLILKVKVISCSEATRLINEEDAVMVDLRQHDDFRKGHIIGATNLSPTEIKTNNIDVIKKYKVKPIIVVDDTGMQAYESANELIKVGFENVCILKDGISGWIRENLPLVCSK